MALVAAAARRSDSDLSRPLAASRLASPDRLLVSAAGRLAASAGLPAPASSGVLASHMAASPATGPLAAAEALLLDAHAALLAGGRMLPPVAVPAGLAAGAGVARAARSAVAAAHLPLLLVARGQHRPSARAPGGHPADAAGVGGRRPRHAQG